MSYFLTVSEEWNHIHPDDLWAYNKLHISRVLGYTCGPAGLEVPKPDFYIVRPMMNLMGMGRKARIEWIDSDTEHLHPGEFWCEVFQGEHLSVDFRFKKSALIVKGERHCEDLYRWSRWIRLDNREVEFPVLLDGLVGEYEWINIEMIGGRMVEVHFRRNPDFRYGNSVAIPVWNEGSDHIPSGYRYIEDNDYKRKGFWIDE